MSKEEIYDTDYRRCARAQGISISWRERRKYSDIGKIRNFCAVQGFNWDDFELIGSSKITIKLTRL